MKRIAKGYCIAAGLLLLWAAADLSHYAANGGDLISYYDGAGVLLQLVHHSLFQALVKLLLGGLVLLIGWRRRDAGQQRPAALTALTLRLGAGLLAAWLAGMGCATFAVAQTLFDLMVERAWDYNESFSTWISYWYDDSLPQREAETPGYLENRLLELLQYTNGHSWSSTSWLYEEEDGGPSPLRDVSIPIQTAVILAGSDGQVLQYSRDFLSFGYLTQETYEAEGLDAIWDGYGWMDLSDPDSPQYAVFRDPSVTDGSMWDDFYYLKITGVWDGTRLEPVAMSRISYLDWSEALDQAGPTRTYTSDDGATVREYDYTAEELMERGLLAWDPLFDETAHAPAGELVTVYAIHPDRSLYDPGEAVGPWRNREYWSRYEQNHLDLGRTDPRETGYASLLELLDTMRRADSGTDGAWGNVHFWQNRIDDLIVLDRLVYSLDPSVEGREDFKVVAYTAFRVSPLGAAVTLLRDVYLGSALLVLAILLALRAQFKRRLILPLQVINAGTAAGWTHLLELQEQPPKWAEPWALYQNYLQAADLHRCSKNEIARLTTALDYARTAEENRRQMTSHIAHELKTPLAILHSYAEGLREHIAEDKREKYIGVILAETERMDALVLDMLDLSRLEAGKVKLARDNFSLADVARSVFGRLERSIQAKELQLSFDFPEDCAVTADEGRIAQAVENFATNAVKYTPQGGRVAVSIRRQRGQTTFTVENDCPPLSDETLSKVWDTFYRGDTARSGGGTGLGLAIARTIIELHGGKCAARRTETGAAFSFTL